MARFGRDFVRAATQPAYLGGLFEAFRGVGQLPANIRQQRRKEAFSEIMKAGNAALATGDATNIGRVRRQLEEAGFTKEAAQMAKAEQQARKQQATSGMLMSAVSDPAQPLSPEVIQERLAEGLTPQGLASALQIREALRPTPYFTRAEQIDLSKTYTPKSIAMATNKRDFSLLNLRDEVDDANVAASITLWTDPTQPQAGTVLKTLQDNKGRTIELGTRTKENPQGRIVSQTELEGLEKREKPPVQVDISDKRESALAASLGTQIGEEVSKLITAGDVAVDLRPAIAQSKLILGDQPDIFGSGANLLSGARRATLTLMRGMGVSAGDPLMEEFAAKEGSVDQIRSFTMDFVRKRLDATKGAISDKEMDAFIASVPNLLQTEGGYRKLIEQMESINERAIMYAASLRRARIAENPSEAIVNVQDTWDRFTSDFKYTTFMPPEEQRKLWNFYLQKDGKVNRGEDVIFNFSSGGKQGLIDLDTLTKRAARNKQTTEEYIYDLYYGNTGKTISLDLSGFDF